MARYEQRLAQYKLDVAAFEQAGGDDSLEWAVQSTAEDREAVAADVVSGALCIFVVVGARLIILH